MLSENPIFSDVLVTNRKEGWTALQTITFHQMVNTKSQNEVIFIIVLDIVHNILSQGQK